MAETADTEAKAVPARLGADDWLQAGLDILVEEGAPGLKIPRLCEHLGVTKGSFYWHFQDLDAFLGELAARWSEEGMHVNLSDTASASDLLAAMQVFADPRNRALTRAVRDWAQHDERARTAIRRADEALFEHLHAALLHLGFSPDEAEVRAKILYYTGVGFAHVGPLGKRSSAREQLTATWELLTQR